MKKKGRGKLLCVGKLIQRTRRGSFSAEGQMQTNSSHVPSSRSVRVGALQYCTIGTSPFRTPQISCLIIVPSIPNISMIRYALQLWATTDLVFHIEVVFVFSNFLSLSLSLGINRNFIAHVLHLGLNCQKNAARITAVCIEYGSQRGF